MFFGLKWRATRRSRGSDMRTALKVLTAIGASGVLLTAASPSASPDASANRFTVTVRVADHHSQDVGPRGTSIGDTATHVARLFQQGEQVGREVAHCQYFRTPNGRTKGFQCVVTWTLKGRGQLTMQEVSTQRHPTVRAVTGGTGDFRGAAGTVRALTETRAIRFQARLSD
jgi:hypothetical protein